MPPRPSTFVSLRRQCPRGDRRGVTLLELLVVLTIIGVSAAVVGAMRPPSLGARGIDSLTRARRLAIQRGEPLLYERDADGAWFVRAGLADTVLRGGDGDTSRFAVRIDPLGNCAPRSATPANGASGTAPVRFDPLACRWSAETP